MKLAKWIASLLFLGCIALAAPASAQSYCDPVFGIDGACYADNYGPYVSYIYIDYYSDCTFTNNVGSHYGEYHEHALYPYFNQGWHWTTWGTTSDFRTVDTDSGFTYQQFINGQWVQIEPCT